MKPIHWKRLVIAGSAAGAVLMAGQAVLNGILLRDDWLVLALVMDLPPLSPAWLVLSALLTWMLGLLLVWLQNALLPLRSGPAQASALSALIVWFLVFVYASVWIAAFSMIPVRLLAICTIWGLGETVLASLLAAWVYRK